MRSLEINKQTIYYALYGAKVPILDADGWETGEFTIGYGNPLKFKIRVSPCRGEATDQVFGKSLDYDRTLSTSDKKFSIDEYSMLFIDRSPVLKSDETTDTKPDYKVVGVSKDLNEWIFAVKKVI